MYKQFEAAAMLSAKYIVCHKQIKIMTYWSILGPK